MFRSIRMIILKSQAYMGEKFLLLMSEHMLAYFVRCRQ